MPLSIDVPLIAPFNCNPFDDESIYVLKKMMSVPASSRALHMTGPSASVAVAPFTLNPRVHPSPDGYLNPPAPLGSNTLCHALVLVSVNDYRCSFPSSCRYLSTRCR